MKTTLFGLLVAVFLLIVIGRPAPLVREAQEEQYGRQRLKNSLEAQEEESAEPSLEIRFAASSPEEEPISDIIWLKKAAESALDNGTPYFNIAEQRYGQKFVKRYNMSFTVIEGRIEFVDDPMQADYDAYEISKLVLNQTEE
jgi:hypothetical protein